jgi:hypothetical protein
MRDPVYLRNVRGLPCVLAGTRVCNGRIHAHHAGPRPGMGIKAADDTAIPLCAQHHQEWHNAGGFFRLLNDVTRERWVSDAIQATRTRLAPF